MRFRAVHPLARPDQERPPKAPAVSLDACGVFAFLAAKL